MPRGKSKIKTKAVKSKKSEIELELELEKEKKINIKKIKVAEPKEIEASHSSIIEKDKRLIMWAGVIFFMSIILVLWVLNINSVFKNISGDGKGNGLDFDKITESYNKTLDDLSENLNKINSIKQNIQPAATSTAVAAGQDDQVLNKEDIGALKLKIEELEKKLNSSSTPSSGLPSFE